MKKFVAYFKRAGKDMVAGALCLLAAALLFFSPGAILHTIIKIAGALIVITAIVRFIMLLRACGGNSLPIIPVLNVVFLFALGMILVGMPGGTLRFIFSAIGVYLIINALLQMLKLLVIPTKRRGALWWVDVIFTVVVFALGTWLLLSPGEASRATEIIAGISLTVKAAEILCGVIGNGKSKEKSSESGDIEADFVDKSHEL